MCCGNGVKVVNGYIHLYCTSTVQDSAGLERHNFKSGKYAEDYADTRAQTQTKMVTFDSAVSFHGPDKINNKFGSSQEDQSWNPTSVVRQMRNVLVLPSSQEASSLGLNGPVHLDYSVNHRRRRSLEESIRLQNFKDEYGGYADALREHANEHHRRGDDNRRGGTSDARSFESSINPSSSGNAKHVDGETRLRIPTPPPLCKRISDSHEYHITTSTPKKTQRYKKLGSTSSSKSSKSAYTGGFNESVDLENDVTSCKQDDADTSGSGMDFDSVSGSE